MKNATQHTYKYILWWLLGILYLKFLLWDLIWAFDTTFSGFQFWQGYLTKLSFVALLSLPILLWRSKWYAFTISVLVDLWLIANLMYFRTYFTIIPAASYALAGNLADFTDSVWESLRPADAVFPATTVVLTAALWRVKIAGIIKTNLHAMAVRMAVLTVVPLIPVGAYILYKGGYKKTYESLMYDYSTCGAAVYTIPGALAYEYLKGDVALTPELRAEIDTWLAQRVDTDMPTPDTVPENCIVLLLESFESWPIGLTLEGQEITPTLNKLVADSATFYAPRVLSQVKGARSIDAQLILHTGLLPVNYGAFSYRFTHNEYPSLDKAWRQRNGTDARVASLTVDKRTVWNVAIVAQDFGYDLYDKATWRLDVKTGPRGRLGDDSFLRQSVQLMRDDTFWRPEGGNMVQCVTYSGHTPFTIPENLIRVHFSDKVPERLRHYLEVANYTDRAIGAFLDSISAIPKFANTAVVITGDHEGIGVQRNDFLKNPETAKWLGNNQFVPLIITGTAARGRHDGVMGQVDIYPTLLHLLGLDAYSWHGLGQNILSKNAIPYAVTAQGQLTGDVARMSDNEKAHARKIYDISDLIISSNYFSTNTKQ